jgi:phospholipid/cholesterol/gamma-HCH transport system substrate-binding protein
VNDESEDGFKYNFKKMSKSLGRVESILKNVDEVTGKINRGEGTIGKLVNDETTVESLNHAIEGVNTMIDSASKFQVSVDYNSEFMSNSMVKSYVGLNIQPGPDRYYSLALVDDPKGSVTSGSTSTSVNGQPGTVTSYQNVYQHQFKFSAQFAKNFYDLTVRAGVIESQGGAGVDYSFFNKKLRLSAEIFNFSRQPEGPYLRAYARYKFYSVFYAIAGGDDILNSRGNSLTGSGGSGFIGAGLDFNNDDLKLLLTKVPF